MESSEKENPSTKAVAPPYEDIYPNSYYPKDLKTWEESLIEKRREKWEKEEKKRRGPAIGVALSGGGIRSATLSLGIFQTFARLDYLKKIDWLSTVSGGGYFGGFLRKLFEVHQDTPGQVKEILSDNTSPPLKWLRDHGRYLAPSGSISLFVDLAICLRN